MIADFLASWSLFQNTYLTGWSIAVLLSLAGIWVVGRNQIFMGAAISQASLLGVSISLLAGSALAPQLDPDELVTLHAVGGGVFAVVAALLTARPERAERRGREPIAGWIFLLGSSGSVLLLARSPHGLEELNQLTSSSILGATAAELGALVTLLLTSILAVSKWGRALMLLVTDPVHAAAVGLRVHVLSTTLCVWLGLAIGLSLHASGLTYTFGCLTLPAMAAQRVCREIRTMWIVCPLIGLSCAMLSFVLAHHFDFPPGQATVVLLCIVVAATWGFPRARSSG